MEDFESYDKPVTFQEGDGIELQDANPLQDVIEKIKPLVKQYGKQAAIGIAGLIILYFVYWFFIGSVQHVTITFQDTENTPIQTLSGSIQDLQGNVIKPFSGSQTTIDVKPGDFKVVFDAQTLYKTSPQTFTVTEEKKSEIIHLEKDFDISITQFFFPDQFVVGEQKTFEIATIQNNESKKIILEPLMKPLDGFTFQFEPSQLTLFENDIAPLTLIVTVSSNTEVSNESDGDAVTGEFRFKYLAEDNPSTQKLAFQLFPVPELSISPTSKLSLRVAAGDSESKQISVTNKSEFAVENLELRVAIDASAENNPETVESWFSWSLCPGEGNSCIVSLQPGQKLINFLKLELPVSAKDDAITGNIVFSNSFVSKTIFLELEVSKADIDLRSSLSRENITVRKNDLGLYDESRINLTLNNAGDVEIDSIEATIENCASEFAYIPNASFFPLTLDAGQRQTFEVAIAAPGATAVGSTKDCSLLVSFDNPATGLQEATAPLFFTITTAD